jgi:hypothetical protein
MTTFEQAQDSHKFAQNYIDNIELGEKGRYVSSIIYTDKVDIQAFMRCRPKSDGIRTKSKIIVPKNAFFPNITEQDFLSTLLDHELIHAEQYYRGTHFDPFLDELERKIVNLTINFAPSLNIGTYREIMTERDAYENQLQNIEDGLRNVSERKKSHLKEVLISNKNMKTTLQALKHIAENNVGVQFYESRAKELFGRDLIDLITTPEGTSATEQELIRTFIK